MIVALTGNLLFDFHNAILEYQYFTILNFFITQGGLQYETEYFGESGVGGGVF